MIIDLVVIAALLVSALVAFLRGFIREVLTIIGVVGGFFAAVFGGPLLAKVVANWLAPDNEGESEKLFGAIPYDMAADAIAYSLIFIVVVIVLSVASHFIAKTASEIGLGPIDRTLGVIFGLLRGIILLGLLYMPVHLLVADETKKEWFEGSHTMFYLEWTAEALASFLPEDFDARKTGEDAVGETREKLEKLDLLGKDSDEAEKTQDSPEGGESVGYEEDQRQKLDRLIEDENLNR
ncbi:MAG: CvpA family protein [Alphaproteobacteria bacterium]|nr:CvpA family protein [Alphaproteobacteria bacterium]